MSGRRALSGWGARFGSSVGRARGSIGLSSPSPLAVPARLARRLVLVLTLTGLLAACGSSAPAPSSGVPTLIPASSAAASAPSRSASAPSSAASAPSSSASAPSSPGTPAASATDGTLSSVLIDPGLIRILPREIGGRPIEEATAAEASAAGDPSLERVAERFAVAYVSSQSREDWAIASVVGLRANAFGDAEYRSWRDTYEETVCASAGGPGGHAQATIEGRTVFIGTCGGLRIYHVLLAAPARVVSVTSAGAADFGERLVGGLRP